MKGGFIHLHSTAIATLASFNSFWLTTLGTLAAAGT